MSEQKYYVKLKSFTGQPKAIQLASFGFCGELVDFVIPKVSRGNYLLKKPCTQFTKSELAEIMDGALYTQTDSLPFEWLYSFESLKEKLGWEFNETIDKWEYYNPIIELVPVEEAQK